MRRALIQLLPEDHRSIALRLCFSVVSLILTSASLISGIVAEAVRFQSSTDLRRDVRQQIQIVRPLASMAETQPQLKPAWLRLSAIISQYLMLGGLCCFHCINFVTERPDFLCELLH